MKKTLLFFYWFVFLFLPICVLADQIDINSANLSQLDELTGIGPAYAQRIIDNRPYSSLDDLLRVKGIGPATLQKIKTQGYACVNCSISPETSTSQANNPTTTATQAKDQSSVQTAIDQSQEQTLPAADQSQNQNPATVAENNPAKTYPDGIFINEVLPAPQGADELNEWIELYNGNNFDVNLEGWKIQDKEGITTTYTFPKDAKIESYGYLTLKRPQTKIILNNDGDGLDLMSPDGKIASSVSFLKAPLGQSYNRTLADWEWSATPTPGEKNIITAHIPPKNLSKQTKSDSNGSVNAATAAVSLPADNLTNNSNQNKKGDDPWFLFAISTALIIISGGTILFIKLKPGN